MPSVSSRPVARLSSPGDIVATIPSLCGFQPQDSVVVLSLRGPRRRLGLTLRHDLPPVPLPSDLAQALVERVAQDGASAAVVVVFADAPHQALVDALAAACAQREIEVAEALHVTDGRWTSYLCTGPCCPSGGTPVGEAPPLVRAQQALDGRAVLPSREDLVRSLAPADDDPGARDRLAAARAQWKAQVARDGVRRTRAAAVERAREALALVAAGGCLEAATAAQVAVDLHDVRVRDEVATWALEQDDALLALTEQVARLVVPPHDAPVCALLAWVSYARGDGARAAVALDRALCSDPSYSLALLLQAALDRALPPELVRQAMRAVSSPG